MSVIPWPYRLLALTALGVALIGFGWIKGASHVQAQWDAAIQQRTLQAAAIRERQAQATVKVVTQYVDRVRVVREKGDTIIKYGFDIGKAVLSDRAKADLCAAASAAEGVDNALLLVVGYTDSTGSEELNQRLSEARAGRVVNYLQQACGWKPYRMLTPTGMAEADPAADNETYEGKALNRRVAVNVLVSKGLDGM